MRTFTHYLTLAFSVGGLCLSALPQQAAAAAAPITVPALDNKAYVLMDFDTG